MFLFCKEKRKEKDWGWGKTTGLLSPCILIVNLHLVSHNKQARLCFKVFAGTNSV